MQTPIARPTAAPLFTMTDATFFGRGLVKFGSIALVVMIVGRVLLTAAVAYWVATHPEPPPPPTAGFGKLPVLNFPVVDEIDKPQAYSLELPEGKFTEFGDRAKVFLMPKAPPNLLADQKVKALAGMYDFKSTPQILDSRTYRWSKSQPIEMNLQMDIQNTTFSLTSNFLSKPELLLNNELPENYEAVSTLKTLLSAADMLPEDVSTNSGKVTFLKAIGGSLQPAVSLSDADFLQVDLNRTLIDETYDFFGPDSNRGVISALLSGNLQGSVGIVELEYHYFPVDYAQMETYPIRTPEQAWSLISAGEGYIANPSTQATAIIRSAKIGYYEDPVEQEYLQPIYVFEGDGGFVGYVSAVDPRYITTPQPLVSN